MKPGDKFNLVARIQGQSNDLDSSNKSAWFVCGIGHVNKEGKLAIKLLGLPLPQQDWDGWMYLRERIDYYGGENKPPIQPPSPPLDPITHNPPKPKWSKKTGREPNPF